MGERFGLVAEEQHDVTGLSLRFEQLPAQARPVHGVGVLPTFQRVAAYHESVWGMSHSVQRGGRGIIR
jgi:hypothetical protein